MSEIRKPMPHTLTQESLLENSLKNRPETQADTARQAPEESESKVER